jgi:AcrR family transcriptional regulator
MARKEDTRIALIEAAQTLFHQQGFHRTTLADVAAAAHVPVGSVYYYFQTKEALALAVISAHAEDIRHLFARLNEVATPRQRLQALLASSAKHAGIFARYGCPYGTLAVELDKSEDALVAPVGNLLALYVEWVAAQYQEMGAVDAARALAVRLVAAMQGAYLLANAFRDPALLTDELTRLSAVLEADGRMPRDPLP